MKWSQMHEDELKKNRSTAADAKGKTRKKVYVREWMEKLKLQPSTA